MVLHLASHGCSALPPSTGESTWNSFSIHYVTSWSEFCTRTPAFIRDVNNLESLRYCRSEDWLRARSFGLWYRHLYSQNREREVRKLSYRSLLIHQCRIDLISLLLIYKENWYKTHSFAVLISETRNIRPQHKTNSFLRFSVKV